MKTLLIILISFYVLVITSALFNVSKVIINYREKHEWGEPVPSIFELVDCSKSTCIAIKIIVNRNESLLQTLKTFHLTKEHYDSLVSDNKKGYCKCDECINVAVTLQGLSYNFTFEQFRKLAYE